MQNSSRNIDTNFEPYLSTVRHFSNVYAEFCVLIARNPLLFVSDVSLKTYSN